MLMKTDKSCWAGSHISELKLIRDHTIKFKTESTIEKDFWIIFFFFWVSLFLPFRISISIYLKKRFASKQYHFFLMEHIITKSGIRNHINPLRFYWFLIFSNFIFEFNFIWILNLEFNFLFLHLKRKILSFHFNFVFNASYNFTGTYNMY